MRFLLILFLLATGGCATWFPAAVKKIDEGVYTITATGNSFASQATMKRKIEKKAQTLCKESGYDITKDEAVEWLEQKNYSTGVSTTYQQMSMTVACRNASQ